MKTLKISSLGKTIQLSAEQILYLQADINYTTIHMLGKAKHTMSFTLRKVEERIASNHFLRINRGISINKNFISRISLLKKEAFVVLQNGIILPVSRRKYNSLKDSIKIID
jgi:DNA-binding LytR/AlgR family response regulator